MKPSDRNGERLEAFRARMQEVHMHDLIHTDRTECPCKYPDHCPHEFEFDDLGDPTSSGGCSAKDIWGALRRAESDAYRVTETEDGFEVDTFDEPSDLTPANSSPNTEPPPRRRRWKHFLSGDADGNKEHLAVIEDLIHEGTVGILFGPTGSLKTQQMLDIAAHVGVGKEFRGRKTKQGVTVYVAAEGQGAIEKRIAAIRDAHAGLPHDAIVGISSPVNLADDIEAVDFAEYLAEEVVPDLSMPIRALVFDTLKKCTPGQSDSGDDVISAVEANARLIAERVADRNSDGFTPAAACVHHPKKDGQTYRGSSTIECDFDWLFEVERDDAEELEERLFTVTAHKVKDGPDGVGWAYRAKLAVVGIAPSGKENKAPIVRYLDESEAAEARKHSQKKRPKVPKGAKRLLDLMERIQARDGVTYVPTTALADSGFIAQVREWGWDPDVPINGVEVATLKDMFMREAFEAEREATPGDSEKKLRERLRGQWRRSIEDLGQWRGARVFDGWAWAVSEDPRTVDTDGRAAEVVQLHWD